MEHPIAKSIKTTNATPAEIFKKVQGCHPLKIYWDRE
jgi:hypothetical protein